MRKKEIYGNYVKRSNATYESDIKELPGQLQGYSALIRFTTGNKALFVENNGRKYCLAADGYTWLMILPLDKCWCLTAMYNTNNEVVEWYFDISKENFVDEHGVPCIDDLYLDLVLLPDGSIFLLDENELQEALDLGKITKDEFDFAYKISDELSASEWINVEFITTFCSSILSAYAPAF